MSQNDVSSILRASQDYKLRTTEFQGNLDALYEFENNISHVNKTFADIDVVYTDDYSLEIKGVGTFPMSDQTITDIMQKSGSRYDASAKTFDHIRDVPNLSAERPIGFDYFSEHVETSKRDVKHYSTIEHRLLFVDSKVVGVKNHQFPYDVFNLSDFIPAFMEIAEYRGKTIENPQLDFNPDTGRVFGEFLFDTVTIKNASVNDVLGYGLKIKDGKLGGYTFDFNVGMRILACSNGIQTFNNMLNMSFKHTSQANYARHFAEFFIGNYGENYIHNTAVPQLDKKIIRFLELEEKMTFDEDPIIDNPLKERLNRMLAETVFDRIDNHKQREVDRIETAASTNFGDFSKKLDEVWNRYRLPKRDFDLALQLAEDDDLINDKNPSYYDLSNVFSRMANNPSWGEDKVETFQQVAYQVLEVPQ